MRRLVDQLVPPICKTVLRRMRGIPSGAIGGSPGLPTLSGEDYRIAFTRVEVGGEVHFVPAYALHRPACQQILSGSYYEPQTHELVQALLGVRNGDLIHAGTFFGDMLPSFSKSCSGTVYAFEPVLENYVLAKLSIEANDLDNVVIINSGLGSKLSTTRIDTGEQADKHHGGASQIAATGQRTSLMTIDTLELKNVSVLQLDVEGFELEALRGAVRTLRASVPTVLIEDNNSNCAPFLQSISYSHVGSVPGLEVWAAEPSATEIRRIVQDL